MNKSFTYSVERGLATVVQCTWQFEHSMNFRLHVCMCVFGIMNETIVESERAKWTYQNRIIKYWSIFRINSILFVLSCHSVFFSHLTKRHWTEHAERAKCLFENVRVSYPFSTVAFALENYLCPYRHDKWTGTKPLIIANWNETFCLQFYLLFGYFQWSNVFFLLYLPLHVSYVECHRVRSMLYT